MKLITPPQAAKIVGISKATLRKHYKDLGGKKIGTRIYFDEESLRSIVKETRP